MYSPFKAIVILAIFTCESFAMPVSKVKVAIQERRNSFWPHSASDGPITAIGANGGYNYNGDGANGGYLGIQNNAGGGPVYVKGSNGGKNLYGNNGANGGSISIGRRQEEYSCPAHQSCSFPASITTSTKAEALAKLHYGANGGNKHASRRGENIVWPFFQPHVAHTKRRFSAAVNSEKYMDYGDGAVAVPNQFEVREDASLRKHAVGSNDWNFWQWYDSMSPSQNAPTTVISSHGGYPVKPNSTPFIATGQNGGVSFNGNGANGGKISISLPWPNRPAKLHHTNVDTDPVEPDNGPIVVDGQNGVSVSGEGANGGTISIPGRTTTYETVASTA